MSIVQTDKQLNLASKMVTVGEKLDDLANEMTQLAAEWAQAGTILDATLEGSSLKHVNVADLTLLNTRFTDLTTWLNASQRRDVLRKVRR